MFIRKEIERLLVIIWVSPIEIHHNIAEPAKKENN